MSLHVGYVSSNPVPCKVHKFAEWQNSQAWCDAKLVPVVERVCRDCGRIETHIPEGALSV